MTTLVAGVGNILLGDDGFGVEVARRLAALEMPAGVRVADFGIRGVHLAYELLDGYDLLVLIDAMSRGGAPGTIYVLEANVDALPESVADGHSLDPASVLAMVKLLGGTSARTIVVGCEPAALEEGIGLSDPVARAVDEAIRVVLKTIDRQKEAVFMIRKLLFSGLAVAAAAVLVTSLPDLARYLKLKNM